MLFFLDCYEIKKKKKNRGEMSKIDEMMIMGTVFFCVPSLFLTGSTNRQEMER